ncbi:hypothetical protein [Acinetobacter nosocomialis]|jgi:hypothetical protein|uniref:hypothetical protein n=1 Tax=Acinetobacter nosocomialis TaxID=106654 RepID=UPI0034CEB10B
MTYFIGGSWDGKQVPIEEMINSEIVDFGEKLNSVGKQRKIYRKMQVSFHGTIKTFYIIEGKNPIDFRDQIIDLWDQVKTDVYAI